MNDIDGPKTFREKYFLELRNNFSGSGKRANLNGAVSKWNVYFFLQLIGLGFLAAFIYELREGINFFLLSAVLIISAIEVSLFFQLKSDWSCPK